MNGTAYHPRLGLAAGMLVVAALLPGCGRDAPKGPEKGIPNVMVQTVERKDATVSSIYVAQTQSSQSVNIQARVSGFLDKRVYTEGAVVKAGQILFQMDPKPFQAQLDAQNAALQRNQASLEVAKANLARTKPLVQQNALSQKDLDDATGQYEQAAAAVEQQKAQVTQAQLNLSYTTIRSPVDGVTSFAAVADGTYLSPQNSQLTTVSVLTPMWINFSISENEMQRIRNDVQAGRVKLPENGRFVVEIEMVDGSLFPYTGRITFTDPSFNSSTGTFQLRATVDNPNGLLRPNQYVRARVKGAIRPDSITVPQRAVQQSSKGHFVWIVNKDSKAELRPIVVGEWYGDSWFVSEGLEAGDRVVVDGGLRLAEGVEVKSTPWVAPAAPAAPASPAAGSGAPGKDPLAKFAPPPGGPPAASGGKAGAAAPAKVAAATPLPGSMAVYFARGQSALDANAQQAIRLAAASTMAIGTTISVTGYADKTGNEAANIELAKQRALAVRDALVGAGLLAERIRLVPPRVVTGSGSDDQARRVDIAVAQ